MYWLFKNFIQKHYFDTGKHCHCAVATRSQSMTMAVKRHSSKLEGSGDVGGRMTLGCVGCGRFYHARRSGKQGRLVARRGPSLQSSGCVGTESRESGTVCQVPCGVRNGNSHTGAAVTRLFQWASLRDSRSLEGSPALAPRGSTREAIYTGRCYGCGSGGARLQSGQLWTGKSLCATLPPMG